MFVTLHFEKGSHVTMMWSSVSRSRVIASAQALTFTASLSSWPAVLFGKLLSLDKSLEPQDPPFRHLVGGTQIQLHVRMSDPP